MVSRKIIWSANCLALCLLGIFICGQVTGPATFLIWWVLHRTNETYLTRSIFQFKYFFPLRALYGLLLGLIPISLCTEALRSTFGLFRNQNQTPQNTEMDWHRPILWAWAPVGLLFALRFITWQAPNQSVLSSGSSFERFNYFFNPMALTNLNYLSSDAPALVFTFVIITGPMVFLMAYTTGVWLRHQRPSLQHTANDGLIKPTEQSLDPH